MPDLWEWRACGASVAGSEHLRRGLGCDDAFAYGFLGDYFIAAVADGAGSVTGTSAWGSFVACQSVLALGMSEQFRSDFLGAQAGDADPLMRSIFEWVLIGLNQQAERMALPSASLLTTLAVAVANPRLALFGQIGDGVIASRAGDVIATHLIEEKSGYANATWFVQSEGAFQKAFRVFGRERPDALALSTDGMSYKITDIGTGNPYKPFFVGAWEHVRSKSSSADLAGLLRGIKNDQTGDDKTLVLAVLCPAADRPHTLANPLNVTVVTSAIPPMK